jgi:hypothetical protein
VTAFLALDFLVVAAFFAAADLFAALARLVAAAFFAVADLLAALARLVAAAFFAGDFLAAGRRAEAFLEVDFFAVDRFADFFAVDFLAATLLAVDFLVVDFLAGLRVGLFEVGRLAVRGRAGALLGAGLGAGSGSAPGTSNIETTMSSSLTDTTGAPKSELDSSSFAWVILRPNSTSCGCPMAVRSFGKISPSSSWTWCLTFEMRVATRASKRARPASRPSSSARLSLTS